MSWSSRLGHRLVLALLRLFRRSRIQLGFLPSFLPVSFTTEVRIRIGTEEDDSLPFGPIQSRTFTFDREYTSARLA